jgi:hypothetical protein
VMVASSIPSIIIFCLTGPSGRIRSIFVNLTTISGWRPEEETCVVGTLGGGGGGAREAEAAAAAAAAAAGLGLWLGLGLGLGGAISVFLVFTVGGGGVCLLRGELAADDFLGMGAGGGAWRGTDKAGALDVGTGGCTASLLVCGLDIFVVDCATAGAGAGGAGECGIDAAGACIVGSGGGAAAGAAGAAGGRALPSSDTCRLVTGLSISL